MGRSSATVGVRHVVASTNRGIRTESWSYETVQTAKKQKCFVRTLRRKESDNLMSALDGLVKVLVRGFQERSRLKMMEELRKFITTENQEAVKIGDLEKTQGSRPVLKHKFSTEFPETVVQMS